MRRIVFVKDYGTYTDRPNYDAALDALIDPVMEHLPGSIKSPRPIRDALNVRYFVATDDAQYDVFVSHGIADKRWRDYWCVRDYAHIFHSGPAWQAKYLAEGAPPYKLHEVGYAKLDPVFQGKVPRGDGASVLWAPTHHRSWPKHYPQAEAAVAALPFHVATSKHPSNVGPGQSTLQALVDADVVIADGGSTVYEAWAIGKPVVFPDWIVLASKMVRPATFETRIYAERIGYHAVDPADFERQIARALEQGITDAERDFIETILPTRLRGTSGKAHADALREIAELPVLRPFEYLPKEDQMAALRAKVTFSAGPRWVRAGDIISSDDPVVAGREALFERPDDLVPVERATAAPGERRTIARRLAKH